MSKTVGKLRAILRLDGTKFDKDVKRQKSKISRFATFAKRAFAPLAAAAAAIGTARGVKNTLDMVDAQAKLARSLGTTVKSMQVLARAGDLAGVGQAQLEQGSKDLFRRLSQAAARGGPAADALKRLKLSAGDLLKLPLDERISKVNEALLEHVPAAERAAIAGALFGEEGAIAMTRLDPATLRQASQELEKYGRAISDIEASKIEQANDALSRISLFVKGIGTDLTIALAPGLTKMADKLSSFASGWRVVWSILKDVIYFIGEIRSKLSEAVSNASGLTTLWPKALQGISKFFVGVKNLLSGLRAVSEMSGGLGEVWNHLGAIGGEVASRIGVLFQAMGIRIGAAFKGLAGSVLSRLGIIVDGAYGWAESLVDIAIGAKDAFVAAFEDLPNALGSLMFEAARAAVRGVESLINGVVRRVNSFIASINSAITSMPSWARGGFSGISEIGEVSLAKPDNPFADPDGGRGAVIEAFEAAQGQTDFGSGGSGLTAAGEALTREAAEGRGEASDLLGGLDAPLDTLADLRAAIEGARKAQAEALAETEQLGDGLDDLGNSANTAANSMGGGSSAGGISEAAKTAAEKLKSLRDGVKGVADELAGAALQGKSFGEIFSNALKKVAQTWLSQGIESILVKMSGLGGGGGGNLFGRILGGLFGARAMGGGVRAGQIYQVNENTPRSEWLFSSGNGGVLNHGQMTSAVNQALGGGNSQQAPGLMRIMLGDGLRAELLNEAAAQSAEITRMGIQGNNSAVRQTQRRG